MNNEDIIGRIFDVQFPAKENKPAYAFNYKVGPNDFHLLPPSSKNVDVGPVHAIVLRAESKYRKFAMAFKDTPLWINDVVITDPYTSLAIEMLIGARIGVKRGATVVLVSDDTCKELDRGEFHQIKLNSTGVYAKFHKQEQPMTIQTKGGVFGIKG